MGYYSPGEYTLISNKHTEKNKILLLFSYFMIIRSGLIKLGLILYVILKCLL